MSVTKKAIVFLVMTFAVSWTALIFAWLHDPSEIRYVGVGIFGPPFAALVCSIAFERGQRLKALGLRFRPNWWWLWALLIAFGLIGLTILITTVFSPHKLTGTEDLARQLAALQHQHYSDARAYLYQTAGAIGNCWECGKSTSCVQRRTRISSATSKTRAQSGVQAKRAASNRPRSCGAAKSSSGPSGTIRVGLIAVMLM